MARKTRGLQGDRVLLSAATYATRNDHRLCRRSVLRISHSGPFASHLQPTSPVVPFSRLQIGLPTTRLVTLRWLLEHNSWLHKTKGGHGQPRTSSDLELRHRFYVGSLFILVGRHPRYLTLQDALPRLPVPSLEHTRDQLLETVRPIVNDHQYIQCQKAFHTFMQPGGEGQRLQAMPSAGSSRPSPSTHIAHSVAEYPCKLRVGSHPPCRRTGTEPAAVYSPILRTCAFCVLPTAPLS